MPKPGDTLSLRWWSGKPYRSKQRVICEATVTRVDRCLIADGALYIDEKMLTVEECNAFARADGFPNANDLWDWFRDTHGLPFMGIVIYWQNTQGQPPQVG